MSDNGLLALSAPARDAAAVVPRDDADGVFMLDGFAEISGQQSLVQPLAYRTSAIPSPLNSDEQPAQLLSLESAEPGVSDSPLRNLTAGSGNGQPISMDARTSGPSLSTTTCSSSDDLDPEAFPAIRSSSGSSSRSTFHQLSGSWSKGGILTSLHNNGQGNPMSRNLNNTSTSTSSVIPDPLLVQGAPRRDGLRNRAEEEADELKFVLELSLAEARSRGEL